MGLLEYHSCLAYYSAQMGYWFYPPVHVDFWAIAFNLLFRDIWHFDSAINCSFKFGGWESKLV